MQKTYYIKTLGCQANIADSNTIAGLLEALDFLPYKIEKVYENEQQEMVDVLGKVDLFILNTCSIRQKSEDKAYGVGRHLRLAKDATGHKPFVVMSGCMVGSVTGERQRYEFEKLQKKTQWVDLYINPSQIFELPNKLFEKGILSDWALSTFDVTSIVPKSEDEKRAFVNISQGCDNFCTFCVVPYARGKEVSRTKKEILGEINHLAKRGVTHITLCGQNVNSWGLSMSEKFEIRTGSDHQIPFADLLREIHAIDGIQQIDFVSSNPFDFANELIETIKLPKISNYMHIAVQSGNNEVLKKMNRRHTVEDFIYLADRLKVAKPQLELGTDIIVGFPGETREQFLDTVELFKRVDFAVAYISMYSQREGTPATRFYVDDVTKEEKKWRHAYLTKIWNDSKRNKNEI